jgi:RNA polymerase sigma factor (sigma-70 family)
MWRRAPDTELQALMEAVPGETTEDSRASRYDLLYAILDALDSLSEREQYIFAAHTYERLSIRKIAVQLGCSKSAMHRELVGIRNRLQALLDISPTVRLHLRYHDEDLE